MPFHARQSRTGCRLRGEGRRCSRLPTPRSTRGCQILAAGSGWKQCELINVAGNRITELPPMDGLPKLKKLLLSGVCASARAHTHTRTRVPARARLTCSPFPPSKCFCASIAMDAKKHFRVLPCFSLPTNAPHVPATCDRAWCAPRVVCALALPRR